MALLPNVSDLELAALPSSVGVSRILHGSAGTVTGREFKHAFYFKGGRHLPTQLRPAPELHSIKLPNPKLSPGFLRCLSQ